MPTIVENNAIQMPLLALRGVVVFPNTVASFDVGRKKSINALKFAMDKNQLIYLVTQKDFMLTNPKTVIYIKSAVLRKLNRFCVSATI
jgi:ATP-dependent Lon protease